MNKERACCTNLQYAAQLRSRPAPSAYAASGRALPCTQRLRGERQGSALHPRFFCKKIE